MLLQKPKNKEVIGGWNHVRGNRVLEDASKVADESANSNSLVTQASGRGLSDDRITD